MNYIISNKIWEWEKRKKNTHLIRNTKTNNTEKKGGMKHDLNSRKMKKKTKMTLEVKT